jgi:hypothetical protein
MYNPLDPLNDFPHYVLNRLNRIEREMLRLAVERVYIQGQTDAIQEERLALQRSIAEELWTPSTTK